LLVYLKDSNEEQNNMRVSEPSFLDVKNLDISQSNTQIRQMSDVKPFRENN
jgi:hypothetical protein